MLNRLIRWCLEHRALVLLLALGCVGFGLLSLSKLRVDAFPDTTPVQVQINTVAPALSPRELEQQITFPVEQLIAGISGLSEVRSISKFGLSQVTAQFEDGTDVYFARQRIGERLATLELPFGLPQPEMGPVATGLGEIFHNIQRSESLSLEELTTLHDWEVKPRLRSVPGVAEVNTWGGEKRQYQVIVDPARLIKFGLSLDDLAGALRDNNLNVGGGVMSSGGELRLVRGVGLTRSRSEIEAIVVAAHDGAPVRVGDLAEVKIGHEIRRGAVTAAGRGEVVLGLAFMLQGENSREMSGRLRERLEQIAPTLPEGVELRTVYDRTTLVDDVLSTVKLNLYEGALLVVAVLFAFLGSLRAGLIVAAAIPLSMMFAFSGMLKFGIAASLMSLGAIDFGLIVDSSVIVVENAVRKLAAAGPGASRREAVAEATIEVRRPTLFGELIIMIVYLPILTLEGTEGQLFRPMALTVVFALLGSLVLSVTLMPVLASYLLPRRLPKREPLLVRAASRFYRPLLRLAIRGRHAFLGAAVVLMVVGVLLGSRLGSEFIPRLSEGSVVINTVRLTGVSLEESVRYGGRLEQTILEAFPDEVEEAWVRTGTAEVATDPMGVELSDVFLRLRPREDWTRASSQAELVERLREDLAGLPGMRMIFTQPIEMRINEMVAGIRSDLGVKVFGDDLDRLVELAAEVEAVLSGIPGCADPYSEQVTGQPILRVQVDQAAIARHGVSARHVLEMVEALGGWKVGEVLEGERRFDLVIRLDDAFRADPQALGEIQIPTLDGRRLPLSALATIHDEVGPATITREWQKRRVVVQCNVVGRDLGGFVAEAQRRLDRELDLPTGYHLEFGGQFEHLLRARARLGLVVPLALTLILLLLYASTRSWFDTLIVFTGAPFAALGGVAALTLRDMPFTISAGVGFVALSGVAMLNGLVLVSTIRTRLADGNALHEAIEQAARMRLRPVLMTALVASLGFLPMALNTGVGAEVQRPLATVVVGGVLSDTLLTLLMLPALFAFLGHRSMK